MLGEPVFECVLVCLPFLFEAVVFLTSSGEI
jgi:hypothetical protein